MTDPPELDFDRTAHLAHFGPAIQRPKRALGGLLVGYGLAGLFGALLLFSRMVIKTLGLPTVAIAVVWAVIALATLGSLGWFFVSFLRANREVPVGGRIRTDERYRVRCIGPDARLQAIRRLGPIDDNPFEPQEFTGFLVLPPRPRMVTVWVVTSVLIAGLVYLIPFGIPPGAAIFVFYGAFAAGGVMMMMIWPTTIRVVPGRVEVIRRLVFRPDRPEVRTFTLRTSPVLVDLRKWRAFVDGPSRETSVELWLWPVPGRLELAHALMMGAVSSARPARFEDAPTGG